VWRATKRKKCQIFQFQKAELFNFAHFVPIGQKITEPGICSRLESDFPTRFFRPTPTCGKHEIFRKPLNVSLYSQISLQLAREGQELVVEAFGEAVMAFFVRVEPVGAAWDVDFLLLVGREETAEGVGVDDRNGPYRRSFLD
jgi:hypothetical protein